MPLEVAREAGGDPGAAGDHHDVLGIPFLRGLREVVASGDDDGGGRARVDEDDLVVEGGVFAVRARCARRRGRAA